MSTIFSKIISGELPSFNVAEDEYHIAILDIFPLVYGHVLVIPKKEVDYIFDISSNEYLALFKFAKKVAAAMQKAISCKRIGISVIGLEVPHTHIHLIPINSVSDMNFDKPKLKFADYKMDQIAQKINSFI
tara:strand:+ start:792 stop:1184 length:393 start_codon:yes stop_codon:yes gene_type:complete